MVVAAVGFLEVSGGHRAMTRQEWSRRTDWNTVCARAAARRKYNEARRHFAGRRRDELVLPLLLQYGFDDWGTCARIARELGCHRSTIVRDRRAILKTMLGL
jgi:hypothetical protein